MSHLLESLISLLCPEASSHPHLGSKPKLQAAEVRAPALSGHSLIPHCRTVGLGPCWEPPSVLVPLKVSLPRVLSSPSSFPHLSSIGFSDLSWGGTAAGRDCCTEGALTAG